MAAVRAPNVPTSLPTLHIYRQLLREAGYLPPALSSQISRHIRRRFHQHINQDVHQQKRLSRARNALRVIRAANYGEPDSMMGLILKAFGRQATRRRELMKAFVHHQDQAVDSKALGALLDKTIDELNSTEVDTEHKKHQSNREGKKFPFLEKWDKKKLQRLLQSQQSQEKSLPTAGMFKATLKSSNENGDVPKTDSWGRAPRPELVRSKQARWWKRASSKLMPPLGKGEWDLLKRLGEGAQTREEAWNIPKRRAQAKLLCDEAAIHEENVELDRYASEPTAQIENRRLSKWRRYYGPSDPNPFGNTPRGAQQRSDRWFRRAYQQGWHMTPHMEQDPNTLAYKFHWGNPGSQNIAPTRRQMLFFEGVDAKGQKEKARKE